MKFTGLWEGYMWKDVSVPFSEEGNPSRLIFSVIFWKLKCSYLDTLFVSYESCNGMAYFKDIRHPSIMNNAVENYVTFRYVCDLNPVLLQPSTVHSIIYSEFYQVSGFLRNHPTNQTVEKYLGAICSYFWVFF